MLVGSCLPYGIWFMVQVCRASPHFLQITFMKLRIWSLDHNACGHCFLEQAKVIKVFPLKYWSTMLTCIIASGQATIVGLCIDRSRKSWSLWWNLQLITIVCSVRLFLIHKLYRDYLNRFASVLDLLTWHLTNHEQKSSINCIIKSFHRPVL